MTDRPIIFSAPMVRALLEGRKTMTRRLANKPVRAGNASRPSEWTKTKPGDRLWVRETWRQEWRRHGVQPIRYRTDGDGDFAGAWRSPIHMPRWASRLTLTVTATKIEPLLDITEDDARAEGFAAGQLDDGFGPRDIGGGFTIESPGTFCTATGMFQIAWANLHPEWNGFSSPEVIALTFTVEKRNIDAAIPELAEDRPHG